MNAETKDHSSTQIWVIPRFLKAPNESGYTGERFQGEKRGFSAEDVAPHQGHIAITTGLPFRISNGFHIRPEDVKEAVTFTRERGAPRIKEYREERLGKLELRAQLLMPELVEIRKKLKVDQ